MPLIPALGKQKQADLCEFDASLVYKRSSIQVSQDYCTEKPCLRKIKENRTNKLANKPATWTVKINGSGKRGLPPNSTLRTI